jgi:putative tricarboxylic transport membrane protein
MRLDRWIAVAILLFSLVYGYAAFNYPLLPFERNMAFLPNTLPLALSALGVVVSLILIIAQPSAKDKEDQLGEIDFSRLRDYKIGQTLGLIAGMVAYAVLLRPIGFLAATALFLAGTGWVLGERKLHVMVPIACIASFVVWYLVQELLGIFLRPWPAFVGV